MHIGFILREDVTRSGAHLSVFNSKVIEQLVKYSFRVEVLVPEQRLWDLTEVCPQHDLYILKSLSPLAVSFAGVMTLAGATVVNSYRSTLLACDKIAHFPVLAARGIPVPASWATGMPVNLTPLVGNDGALWIKPPTGEQGLGVRRIDTSAQMAQLVAPQDAYGLPLGIFAQRDVADNGGDLKLYVVGDQVWGVERSWPATTSEEKLGRPFQVSTGLRDIALACGEALGLELYGVDVVHNETGFTVIDVNPFPGYKGCDGAAAAVAAYLYEVGEKISRNDICLPSISAQPNRSLI